MGGAVMHGEQGTRDVAGQSASKNTWAMLSTRARMGQLAGLLEQLGHKGFHPNRERRKRKASKFDLDNMLNDFD
jgi:hypothetical protein